MNTRLLNEDDWRWVQGAIPILCVDAIPIRFVDGGPLQIGLVLRETPHQGTRWCFLGGRVRRGETLDEALQREWSAALGDACEPGQRLGANPWVVEYRPDSKQGRPHDPRKHAIGLTYAVQAAGVPRARGVEAIEFRWFDPGDLNGEMMGFGQETVVPRVLLGLTEVLFRDRSSRSGSIVDR